MDKRTTVVFENDGTTGINVGTSGSGETVTLDRANGVGMSSGEMLLTALASCTIGTLQEYLTSKKIDIGPLTVEASCGFDESNQKYRDFDLLVKCSPDTPDRVKKAMLNAARTCRIHKTLHGGPDINVEMEASLDPPSRTIKRQR